MIYYMWQVTHELVTYDTWQMASDMWNMTHRGRNLRSIALTFFVWAFLWNRSTTQANFSILPFRSICPTTATLFHALNCTLVPADLVWQNHQDHIFFLFGEGEVLSKYCPYIFFILNNCRWRRKFSFKVIFKKLLGLMTDFVPLTNLTSFNNMIVDIFNFKTTTFTVVFSF